FDGGLFSGDPTITDLTGVGESTGPVFVDNASSQGEFPAGTTLQSGRGTQVGGPTTGFFGPNTTCFTGGDHFPSNPVKISVGGWQRGGACSLSGDLFDSKQLTLHSNLQGHLVNQPPTAIAGDDQTVECSFTGGGTVALDASKSFDPDNNIVSYGWFKGSRTGLRLGDSLTMKLEQPVSTPSSNNETSYVFKVVALFGQYDDDTVKVNVLDRTAPTIKAPDGVTAECTGPTGTPVAIGLATATDTCDAS